jgi:hypothetical protein
MTDDWAKRRLAELQAAAPVKADKSTAFAQISLAFAAKAAAATNCPKAVVWVWLAYRAWKTKSTKIDVPNDALVKLGVSRDVKRAALQQLEEAGLISVKRPSRRTPVVTLLVSVVK